MRRFHLALTVANIERSVADYSHRLGTAPSVVVNGEYALWRTPVLNFSIRRGEPPGTLRHVGWEDSEAVVFEAERDVNGLIWERFSSANQVDEIRKHWPKAKVSAEIGES